LEQVARFHLGFVSDPIPGHEIFRGRLAIPYLRVNPSGEVSVVSIRFRRLSEEGSKYLTLPGDRPRLFNTADALAEEDEIAITEGELDAVAASIHGIPAVGVPGANSWKPHFTDVFLGYAKVWILADGDQPGLEFAAAVADKLDNASIIPMPTGEDVNSTIQRHGVSEVLSRMGKA
jgi:DNA primase